MMFQIEFCHIQNNNENDDYCLCKSIYRALKKKVSTFEIVSVEVSTNLMFTFFLASKTPKKVGFTVFNSPACRESINNKICILGLKLANAFPKGQLGITFVEI